MHQLEIEARDATVYNGHGFASPRTRRHRHFLVVAHAQPDGTIEFQYVASEILSRGEFFIRLQTT